MTTPASGNRWEPAAGTTTPENSTPVHVDHGASRQADPEADTRTSPRWAPRRPRLRSWLVALAAVFFLAGGVGGFVVGHAAAGHGAGIGQLSPADEHGLRPGFDSDGRGTGRDPFGRDLR